MSKRLGEVHVVAAHPADRLSLPGYTLVNVRITFHPGHRLYFLMVYAFDVYLAFGDAWQHQRVNLPCHLHLRLEGELVDIGNRGLVHLTLVVFSLACDILDSLEDDEQEEQDEHRYQHVIQNAWVLLRASCL